MNKEPRKKKVDTLDDDDLYGDFTSMDDFIESDSFEVTSNQKKKSNTFEITADDKKKKPGNARPPKKDVAKLHEDDLFGNFKSMDEFIESDSFEVTTSGGQRAASNTGKKTSSNITKLQDDDLFGDFKPLDEFIESDSFDVTVQKGVIASDGSIPTPPTSPSTTPSPTGGPTPPSISPISTPSQTPVVSSSPPTITPAGSPQSHPEKPKPDEVTKSKLAEIAKKRKEKKHNPPSRKGDVDGLFDDLDPLELDDED